MNETMLHGPTGVAGGGLEVVLLPAGHGDARHDATALHAHADTRGHATGAAADDARDGVFGQVGVAMLAQHGLHVGCDSFHDDRSRLSKVGVNIPYHGHFVNASWTKRDIVVFLKIWYFKPTMIQFTNSLSRKKENFEPIEKGHVGIYTCGPTVYDYASIGNWRTYMLGDMVVRLFADVGMKVNYVMNLTDVGHLTGDNEGDADSGEDRMEKAKAREGKTAWDIAKFYSDDFIESFKKLHMREPEQFCRATDHIEEQIALVKQLEEKGLTYKTSDGIYFDVQAFEEAGYKYGELSDLDEIQAGARVAMSDEKKSPRDFALWKFSPTDAKRDMEWDSPWGVGFPGWHIECSAMSMKYLGNQFDIHVGGEDLKSTHHPNEIAQSEGATGASPFVKVWMHGAFLKVDGGRMGKSIGNAYTLHDIEERGFDPLALRYFYLTAHYRSSLNFTWEALEAAQNALNNLRDVIWLNVSSPMREETDAVKRFRERLRDDLDAPGALAIVWEVTKDESLSSSGKLMALFDMDAFLGFELDAELRAAQEAYEREDLRGLLTKRDEVRDKKDFDASDALRDQIKDLGFIVEDTPDGQRLRPVRS